MRRQVLIEMWLKHEELFFQRILCFHSVLMLDRLLPHPHELPLLELLEEVQLFDVIVGVSLYQPLPKAQELDWGVILIESQTFSTQSIVLLCFSILI